MYTEREKDRRRRNDGEGKGEGDGEKDRGIDKNVPEESNLQIGALN